MNNQVRANYEWLNIEETKIITRYLKNALGYKELRIAKLKNQLFDQLMEIKEEHLDESMEILRLVDLLWDKNTKSIKQILRNLRKSDYELNNIIEISDLYKEELIAQFTSIPKSKMLSAKDPFLNKFFSDLGEEEELESRASKSWPQGAIVLYVELTFPLSELQNLVGWLNNQLGYSISITDKKSDLMSQIRNIPKKYLVSAIDALYPETWQKVDGEYLEEDYGADREWNLRDIIDYMFEWYNIPDIMDICLFLNDERDYDIQIVDDAKKLMKEFEDISKTDLMDAIDTTFDDFWDENLADYYEEFEQKQDFQMKSRGDNSFDYNPDKAKQTLRPYQSKLVTAIDSKYMNRKDGGKFYICVATGGGKTRIANEWIWQHLLPKKKRILWISKGTLLLQQAACDLSQRYKDARRLMGRTKGDSANYLWAITSDVKSKQIVYTTIHTWNSRKDNEFRNVKFDVVIIDEVHWGEGGAMYRNLLRRYGKKAFLLGLTATPRGWTEYDLIEPQFDLDYLVKEGHLAIPDTSYRFETEFVWKPEKYSENSDFTAKSLRQIARDSKRNRFIFKKYAENRDDFGKTLVFACNIDHAETLRDIFNAGQIPAEIVHSWMGVGDCIRAVKKFRRGNIKVMINVAKMIYGIDIPDIKSIFMARPTASRILYKQMIGRGARKDKKSKKDSFYIVDFVDNVKRYEEDTIRSENMDIVRKFSRQKSKSRSKQYREYRYRPAEIEIIKELDLPYSSIENLEIQPKQTFGIEFELTRGDIWGERRPKDWNSVAESILGGIRNVVGVELVAEAPFKIHNSPDKTDYVWNVEYDSSCGWEICTRILEGQSGFIEVYDALGAIKDVALEKGLYVNWKTGTHVHLAWKENWRKEIEKLKQLFLLLKYFEPALFSLVPPSRYENEFCHTINSSFPEIRELSQFADWKRCFSDHDSRFLSVNPSNLFKKQRTLEIRLHGGTLNPKKILTWVSLWMRIVHAVADRYDFGIPEEFTTDLPFSKEENGDILELVDKRLRMLQPMRGKLLKRRKTVMEKSWFKNKSYGQIAKTAAASWKAIGAPELDIEIIA